MSFRNLVKISIESVIAGILTVISGVLISYIIKLFMPSNLPDICKDWNKFHVMEISLFFTGFALHLFLDITGVNKWYCKSETCFRSKR